MSLRITHVISRRLRPPVLTTIHRSISTSSSSSSSSSPSNGGKLANQKCIITGSSRGIGFAIAERFMNEGGSCVLVGRHERTLIEAARRLQEPTDTIHHHDVQKPVVDYLVGNVASRTFWEGLNRDVGSVDVLVNAAGLTHYSLLMATAPDMLDEIIQTNLMGAVWACQILSKNMVRRKKGCIINISSLLAIKGGRGGVAYAASKAGLLGLTRSLAAELGQSNIRVNAIIPGYVETQMTDVMDPKARSQALDAIPLKRFGKPKEIADAALFLAANEYAANCTLNLDGGLSAT